MNMTSNKPYFVRAIYEWIVDNDLTPYVLVDADYPEAILPQAYVDRGRIVLDISPEACRHIVLDNDYITFDARFAGKSMTVSFRAAAVLSIYAKENGRGMEFGAEYDEPYPPLEIKTNSRRNNSTTPVKKPALTLVKKDNE